MVAYPLTKILHHNMHLQGRFVALLAIAAVLLGASFGMQNAYAVVKMPDYKIAVSNPSSSGCQFSGTNLACVQKDVNGLAETWVKDNRGGAHWAQVYHEMNPTSPGTPSSGFVYTDDSFSSQVAFISELNGNGFIDDTSGLNAEARYGGNVFMKSGSSWVFQNWFYAAKTNDGSFSIPGNTEVRYCRTNVAEGSQWTMGSLFESLVDGGLFGGATPAYADVYDLSRQWNSERLEVNGFCGF